jgi:hypothetical protein
VLYPLSYEGLVKVEVADNLSVHARTHLFGDQFSGNDDELLPTGKHFEPMSGCSWGVFLRYGEDLSAVGAIAAGCSSRAKECAPLMDSP